MVSISGFAAAPVEGECYEMAVEYEAEESICYYVYRGIVPPPSILGCSGWEQQTPEFYLTSSDAIRRITRVNWRKKYSN